MTEKLGPAITGIGIGVPNTVVRNDQFARRGLDTSDDWIRKNTGIKQRHVADRDEATSDFATRAAEEALQMADLDAADIGQIIVATATPDMIFPATACVVQDNLKAINSSAYDLSAACTGAIYGLANAYASHIVGMYDNSLVIGAETLSRIVDPNDRSTSVLFGDGAGAVVVQSVKDSGLAQFVLRADGSKGDLLMLPAGGSRFPASKETVDARLHYVQMQGHEVFKEAVKRMTEVSIETLNKAGLTNVNGEVDPRKIDLVIPHQANQRIMDAVGKKLGIRADKMFSNIEEFGNTSAASILIAMHDAYKQGKLNRGDILLIVAFGGGFTYGAGVLQWHLKAPHISLKERFTRRLHK